MKAMIYRATGGPEVIEEAELPTPEPGRDEVRVRVLAAALNHLDIWVRRGMPGIPPQLPHIAGGDVAGVVDAVGDAVTGWQPGQRVVINPTLSCGQCEWCRRGEESLCLSFGVLGEHRWGGFAEYVVVPASNLEAIPDGYDLYQAAAAPLFMVE